jgi:hypothetical protein
MCVYKTAHDELLRQRREWFESFSGAYCGGFPERWRLAGWIGGSLP